MNNLGFEDRRTFERYPVYMPLSFRKSTFRKRGSARTNNLSASGLCIVVEEKFKLLTDLDVLLMLSPQHESFKAKGRVMWTRQLDKRNYLVGVSLEKPELMGVFNVLNASKAHPNMPFEMGSPSLIDKISDLLRGSVLLFLGFLGKLKSPRVKSQ